MLIKLLLFYREHFYGFRKVIYENVEQKPFILQQKNLYTGHRHIKVLSFVLYIL